MINEDVREETADTVRADGPEQPKREERASQSERHVEVCVCTAKDRMLDKESMSRVVTPTN